jgi:hypothetical protein
VYAAAAVSVAKFMTMGKMFPLRKSLKRFVEFNKKCFCLLPHPLLRALELITQNSLLLDDSKKNFPF